MAYFLVRPMLKRVTDAQVALYLEEHEPSLQSAILSAVDATADAQSGPLGPIPGARAQVGGNSGREMPRRGRRRSGRAEVPAPALGLARDGDCRLDAALLWSRLSAPRPLGLLILSRSAEAASPYQIEVQPGNATIPRGSDQSITARLKGFSSGHVELMMRKAGTEAFAPVPFSPRRIL